jgi:type IV secretory pathway VirB10-like protein
MRLKFVAFTPTITISLATAIAFGSAGDAFAQKTYRCGSTYQSYPCALSSSTGSAAPGAKADDKTKAAGVAAPAPTAPKAPELTPEEKKAEEAKQAKLAEAQKVEDAAKAKKARCDKLKDEMGYNAAQQKSGGSKTTMDRLAGDRKQLEADMKKEACPA